MSVNPVAFPADFDHRIIIQVGTAHQVGAFFQPQSRVRFQFDAADEIISGRHDHRAAARRGAGIQRLLERGGVLGRAVADRAERADIERARDKLAHPACPSRRERKRIAAEREWFHGDDNGVRFCGRWLRGLRNGFGRELVEAPMMINPAQLLVGKIQRRRPIVRRQSVPVRFVIDAHAVRAHAQKRIHRLGRQHGLFDRVGNAILVVRAFHGNPRTRRRQCDVPMRVERQFLHLAGEFLEPRHEVIREFPRHVLDAFLAAATGAAETVRAGPGAARPGGRAERDAFIKGRRHHHQFAEPRMAQRDELGSCPRTVAFRDNPPRATVPTPSRAARPSRNPDRRDKMTNCGNWHCPRRIACSDTSQWHNRG